MAAVVSRNRDAKAEAVLFVVEGELSLTLSGKVHVMQPGGYAYIPPGGEVERGQQGCKIHQISLDPQGV